jgi:hypothetical protein
MESYDEAMDDAAECAEVRYLCPRCERTAVYYMPDDNHWYTPNFTCAACCWWARPNEYQSLMAARVMGEAA